MTDSYRMFVELPNGAKFRAQGEVAEVRTDLDRFYALLNGAPKPTLKPDTNGASHPADEISNGDAVDVAEPSLPAAANTLDKATLDRLFAKDQRGTVSLRALPHGDNAEANALVALIYGAQEMTGEPQITGSRLMKAATQSGLQVERIDRSLSTQIGQYVTTAGFKKGRRYGLTNPGIRRAEDVLRGILG